jgi:hypothetical protein
VLSPERAEELLAEHRVEEPEARIEAALAKLPSDARKAALEVATSAPLGRPEPDGSTLDALSASRRVRAFDALLPNLGDDLEAMWQAGAALPYEGGYGRRGFRAPSAPHVSLPRRFERTRHVVWGVQRYSVPDVVWLARWAPHVTYWDSVGTLLGAAIDRGVDAVFDVLVASAHGEDEVGQMGAHVVRGLLTSSREEGWELIAQMLIAAQRQEGLRQTILESADEARPEAFRMLIATVLEHDLARFSATVRAVDVWLGVQFGAGSVRAINDLLERALRYLDDPAERGGALGSGGGEDAYLALWAEAHNDATGAVEPARRLLHDGDPERRWAAAHLLAQLGLQDGHEALVRALDDGDLRVAARAAEVFGRYGGARSGSAFEPLERLLARVPGKRVEIEPLVWSWTGGTLTRADVAEALVMQGRDRPVEALLPHLDSMSADTRGIVSHRLKDTPQRGEARRAVIALLGDPSHGVREDALEAAGKLRLEAGEVEEVEALLRRKAGDLRRGVVTLLLARGDESALASADRLLAGGDAARRMGGLEILRRLVEEERAPAPARERAEAFRSARTELSEDERTQLDAILGAGAEPPPTREDALGLLDPSKLTPPLVPSKHDVELVSDAAIVCLRELDELVHEHRDEEVEFEGWYVGTERVLLADARGLPHPARRRRGQREGGEAAIERGLASFPLHDLWLEWARARPAGARDSDGLELVRALETPVHEPKGARFAYRRHGADAERRLLDGRKPPVLRYGHVVATVLEWLALQDLDAAAAPWVLDAAETMLAAVPRAALETDRRARYEDSAQHTWTWRTDGWLQYLDRARTLRGLRRDTWSRDDEARLWGLEVWLQDPPVERGGAVGRIRGLVRGSAEQTVAERRPDRADVEELVAAFAAGVASGDDVVDHLFGPQLRTSHGYTYSSDLRLLSGRRLPAWAQAPGLAEIVDRGRRRVLGIELARGETPTEASALALELQHSGGLDVLGRLLVAMGREKFVRNWRYEGEARHVVFSHLIRVTMPGEDDTPEAFASEMRSRGVKEQRLVELAAFAPQWVRHVEHALGWEGLTSGVWWMHAHTKDDRWQVAAEVRDVWTAEASERTPLAAGDLLEGAVDVGWFRSAYEQLGAERWDKLHQAAKYGSSSGGHKRAELFADAMRGAADEAELHRRIEDKRHQDAVRALGLMPLPDGATRDDAVLARYQAIQEFVRGSRQFGSQRQASERRAAEIGLENLARTAGYADPIRLGWAMEARGIADLADGPLVVEAAGARVELAIDEDGLPQTSVSRDGRELKSVPPAARRSKEVKALRARASELRRQAARIRRSLELAMVRGDGFTGSELHELSAHLLLAPQLERLVLVGSDGAGYLAQGGRVLRDPSGTEHAIGNAEAVRVAHPLDLVDRDWTAWQRDVLDRRVRQPFKQVFRELYVPTRDELDERDLSRRYAGNQVQPRKALALLGQRGWVAHPEEGVRRTFHDAKVSALLLVLDDFLTPAEVEDVTVEAVRFARAGEWDAMPIADVPPRIFSEVMRDLDLVVSVAHSGGVDPEATASTVEMRAALLEETLGLLGIENVRLQAAWALIDGQIGEYSVHLGSAVVHRRPGGSVCIVPVHGQHRGRVFLPFADDDPKTAEVIAKVLLLARDDQIKDPTILEQLRA